MADSTRLLDAAAAGDVGAVAFSPDGRRLVVAGGYRGRWEIKVYPVADFEPPPVPK